MMIILLQIACIAFLCFIIYLFIKWLVHWLTKPAEVRYRIRTKPVDVWWYWIAAPHDHINDPHDQVNWMKSPRHAWGFMSEERAQKCIDKYDIHGEVEKYELYND